MNRRGFLSGAMIAAAAAWAAPLNTVFAQGAVQQKTRLILLGTKGGPRVGGEGRKNPSTLLLINGVPYVVDCGYGTSQNLVRAGVPLNAVRYFFITHHHSDHNLEYGSVIYNG